MRIFANDRKQTTSVSNRELHSTRKAAGPKTYRLRLLFLRGRGLGVQDQVLKMQSCWGSRHGGQWQTEKNELEVAGSCENTYVRTTESIVRDTYLTYLGLLGMPVTAPLMPLVPYSFIPKAYM